MPLVNQEPWSHLLATCCHYRPYDWPLVLVSSALATEVGHTEEVC